jgi:hypothetical protein
VAVGKTASFGAGGYDVYVVGISPEMAIATDKPSYTPGQKLKILLDLTNRADAFNASVELWLVVGGTFPVFLGVLEPVPVGADVDFTGFPAYEEIVPAGLPANNAFVAFLSDHDTGEFLTWAATFFGVSSRASSKAVDETLSRAEAFAEQRSAELDAR